MLLSKAERAYGSQFIMTSRAVCTRLGIPLDWLLAAICWETTQFSATGPTWPLNKSDGGGGLIGFTPLRGHPAEFMGPVDQLAEVEKHYRRWMATLRISTFPSPEDLYLIVRGPYGIGQPDTFNMGAGYTKGQVLKIYRDHLSREGVATGSTSASTAGEAEGVPGSGPGRGPEAASSKAPGSPRLFVARRGAAKTTGAQVRIRTGPGFGYPTVRFLISIGTPIIVSDQVRGDVVDGNDLWDKIAEGYVADRFVAFDRPA